MSYFIYTDLISSLIDSRLVDPGSTLIYVGTYGLSLDDRSKSQRERSQIKGRIIKANLAEVELERNFAS